MSIATRVMQYAALHTHWVSIAHARRAITRFANGRLLLDDDGDTLELSVLSQEGRKGRVLLHTNELDDTSLQAALREAEMLAHVQLGSPERLDVAPDDGTRYSYMPVDLWRASTVTAMQTERADMLQQVIARVSDVGMIAAGFLGSMARVTLRLDRSGQVCYAEETDNECAITARGKDGTNVGWGGQAERDFQAIRPLEVADAAIGVAKQAVNPLAIEPGRRTAILSRSAVAQLLRFFAPAFDAYVTDRFKNTPFATPADDPRLNRIGDKMFDTRVTVVSDPTDPDGGYPPFEWGLPLQRMVWIQDGILKNLAYKPGYALRRGKLASDWPWSFRMMGGATSVEEMIRSCSEGVYVNRFSNVNLIDEASGTVDGVTSEGCFLIKDGKIQHAIKNFRILESPFFLFNRLVSLGPTQRTAFGYMHQAYAEDLNVKTEWPRWPVVVPPMMVRDFNFASLADTT